jgi:hypothetical protein
VGAPVVARLFSNGLARGLRSAHGRPLLWLLAVRLLATPSGSERLPGAHALQSRVQSRDGLAETTAPPEDGNNEATATK